MAESVAVEYLEAERDWAAVETPKAKPSQKPTSRLTSQGTEPGPDYGEQMHEQKVERPVWTQEEREWWGGTHGLSWLLLLCPCVSAIFLWGG